MTAFLTADESDARDLRKKVSGIVDRMRFFASQQSTASRETVRKWAQEIEQAVRSNAR